MNEKNKETNKNMGKKSSTKKETATIKDRILYN